jgi:hypothetical protein
MSKRAANFSKACIELVEMLAALVFACTAFSVFHLKKRDLMSLLIVYGQQFALLARENHEC